MAIDGLRAEREAGRAMITPPVTIITHGIVAAAAAAGAWVWQANSYEAKLAAVQTEYAQAQARAVEIAHAETLRYQQQADTAAKNAAKRVRAAAADAAVLRDSLDRLSDAADTALRESSDSIAACKAHGATVTELFGQCASRYGAVAGAADGWSNEALMLREAWPE